MKWNLIGQKGFLRFDELKLKKIKMESEIRNCTGKQLINLSRTLSKLLRHQALNQGIEIRSDGFCQLEDVLKSKMIMKMNPTFDDIMACVNDNDKKRFEVQTLDA